MEKGNYCLYLGKFSLKPHLSLLWDIWPRGVVITQMKKPLKAIKLSDW